MSRTGNAEVLRGLGTASRRRKGRTGVLRRKKSEVISRGQQFTSRANFLEDLPGTYLGQCFVLEMYD